MKFIHIPKCGGQDIRSYVGEDIYQMHVELPKFHRPASMYEGELFTVIRDPFARLESYYCYLVGWTKKGQRYPSFQEFVKNKLAWDLSQRAFGDILPCPWMPQSFWVYDNQIPETFYNDCTKFRVNTDTQLIPDENIIVLGDKHLDKIANLLDINIEVKEKKKNTSRRDKYLPNPSWDEEMREIVFEHFKDDFELYNRIKV